ncbi:MAG: glycosyltransferase family 2 protein [Phycisphaerae bacterium]|nr:glycosyltransferase family 2 protein [Phycisphaerae bacterium]
MNASLHPDDSGLGRCEISVFFPCHNEAASVESLVRKTIGVLNEVASDYEIIIVDDGSTDETPAIADRLVDELAAVKVVHHPTNLGYGAALQSGFRAATKEWVFYTDGDAQFDVEELKGILPLAGQYDIVSCYRLNRQEGWRRRLSAFCWNRLVGRVFRMRLKDVDCAFKLYRREIFDRIEMQSQGALIDAEILARALRKGYTIGQAGVRHYPRRSGRSSGGDPRVILRAFRELLQLRGEILRDG